MTEENTTTPAEETSPNVGSEEEHAATLTDSITNGLKQSASQLPDARANHEAAKYRVRAREAEARAAELQSKVDAYEKAEAEREHARQVAELRQKVSYKTAVPAKFLTGDTEEELMASARELDQWAHPKPKGMPNQGKTPQHPATRNNLMRAVMGW